MKNVTLPLGLLAALAATAGCRKMPDPVCDSRLLVPIVSVKGPRQVALNQQVNYMLDVKLGNSCGALDTLVISTGDNKIGPFTQQIGVRAHYTGCSCQTDTLTITPTTYQFRPTNAGIYYLRFLTRQGQYITDTVTVQ